ncbi:hypothetical protein [Streptomyces sp. NBC_00989]|uniref:hypothetical protein n=1 Tax=Streptomyces sp. NBC_00989 TaxID=2903705 RepID=UPI00386FB6A3|nr:hypothetical protein OG714_03670 [Streptomyces sp. NBC_00989]
MVMRVYFSAASDEGGVGVRDEQGGPDAELRFTPTKTVELLHGLSGPARRAAAESRRL